MIKDSPLMMVSYDGFISSYDKGQYSYDGIIPSYDKEQYSYDGII